MAQCDSHYTSTRQKIKTSPMYDGNIESSFAEGQSFWADRFDVVNPRVSSSLNPIFKAADIRGAVLSAPIV